MRPHISSGAQSRHLCGVSRADPRQNRVPGGSGSECVAYGWAHRMLGSHAIAGLIVGGILVAMCGCALAQRCLAPLRGQPLPRRDAHAPPGNTDEAELFQATAELGEAALDDESLVQRYLQQLQDASSGDEERGHRARADSRTQTGSPGRLSHGPGAFGPAAGVGSPPRSARLSARRRGPRTAVHPGDAAAILARAVALRGAAAGSQQGPATGGRSRRRRGRGTRSRTLQGGARQSSAGDDCSSESDHGAAPKTAAPPESDWATSSGPQLGAETAGTATDSRGRYSDGDRRRHRSRDLASQGDTEVGGDRGKRRRRRPSQLAPGPAAVTPPPPPAGSPLPGHRPGPVPPRLPAPPAAPDDDPEVFHAVDEHFDARGRALYGKAWDEPAAGSALPLRHVFAMREREVAELRRAAALKLAEEDEGVKMERGNEHRQRRQSRSHRQSRSRRQSRSHRQSRSRRQSRGAPGSGSSGELESSGEAGASFTAVSRQTSTRDSDVRSAGARPALPRLNLGKLALQGSDRRPPPRE